MWDDHVLKTKFFWLKRIIKSIFKMSSQFGYLYVLIGLPLSYEKHPHLLHTKSITFNFV